MKVMVFSATNPFQSSSVASIRTTPSRFRIGSPAGGPTPIAKSASGNSIDDAERRTLERKIADLEIQLKVSAYPRAVLLQ